MNKQFWVKVKEDGIQPWMKKLGVNTEDSYLVITAMSEMVLLKVEENLVEIYPRHLQFQKWEDQ